MELNKHFINIAHNTLKRKQNNDLIKQNVSHPENRNVYFKVQTEKYVRRCKTRLQMTAFVVQRMEGNTKMPPIPHSIITIHFKAAHVLKVFGYGRQEVRSCNKYQTLNPLLKGALTPFKY